MLLKDLDFNQSDVSLQGIFIGEVIDNMDSKGIERVKLRILGVHDMSNKSKDNAIWVQHCAPSRYESGNVPEIGDFVYCQFMNPNDPMNAIWIGYARTMY